MPTCPTCPTCQHTGGLKNDRPGELWCQSCGTLFDPGNPPIALYVPALARQVAALRDDYLRTWATDCLKHRGCYPYASGQMAEVARRVLSLLDALNAAPKETP